MTHPIGIHSTVKTCFAAIRDSQKRKQEELARVSSQYDDVIQRKLNTGDVRKFRLEFFEKWNNLLNERQTLSDLSYETNRPKYIDDLLTTRHQIVGTEIDTMRYIWQCLVGMKKTNDPLISCPLDPDDGELTRSSSDWQKDRERGYLDESLIEQFAVLLSPNATSD